MGTPLTGVLNAGGVGRNRGSEPIIIIIIINEKINVAFSRRTARTRNSHKKNTSRENVVSNSTEDALLCGTVVRSEGQRSRSLGHAKVSYKMACNSSPSKS